MVINCWGSGIGVLVVAGFLLPRAFQDLSSLKHRIGEVREIAIESSSPVCLPFITH